MLHACLYPQKELSYKPGLNRKHQDDAEFVAENDLMVTLFLAPVVSWKKGNNVFPMEATVTAGTNTVAP